MKRAVLQDKYINYVFLFYSFKTIIALFYFN